MHPELEALTANRTTVLVSLPDASNVKWPDFAELHKALALRHRVVVLAPDTVAESAAGRAGAAPLIVLPARSERVRIWSRIARWRADASGGRMAAVDIPISSSIVNRVAGALRRRAKRDGLPGWLSASVPAMADVAARGNGSTVRELAGIAYGEWRIASVLDPKNHRADVSAVLAGENPLFVLLLGGLDDGFSLDVLWASHLDGRAVVALAHGPRGKQAVAPVHPPAWLVRHGGSPDEKVPGIPADRVVHMADGDVSDLAEFLETQVAPTVIRSRTKAAAKARSNISHAYSANLIARDYCGLDLDEPSIPGFWIHGWLPAYHNVHPGLVAMHKYEKLDQAAQERRIEGYRREAKHWVGRRDQEDFLRSSGYAHVRAIGVPFVYLPEVETARVPGSLLVMPPHGLRDEQSTDAIAEEYATQLAGIREQFSDVLLCLKEDDFARGTWVGPFQKRGIPVFKSVDVAEPNTLLRMKRILSTFEFVTTNGMGSHIAYAAACGAKVSVWGPFAALPDYDIERTSASLIYPGLSRSTRPLYQEEAFRQAYPFLFVEPSQAVARVGWARQELGAEFRLTPEQLAAEFGWSGS